MKKKNLFGISCLVIAASSGVCGIGCDGGPLPGEEGQLVSREDSLEIYRPRIVIRSGKIHDASDFQGVFLYIKAGVYLDGNLRIWLSGKEVEGFVINPQTHEGHLHPGEEGRIEVARFWNGGLIPRNTFKRGERQSLIIKEWGCVKWEAIDMGDGVSMEGGPTRCVREDWQDVTERDRVFFVMDGRTLPELEHIQGQYLSLSSTINKKKVKAGVGSGCRLDAVSDIVSFPEEVFELIVLDEQHGMLRITGTGKFVHVEPDGLLSSCGDVRWDGPHFSNVFELGRLPDGHLWLRALANGKYVRAGHGPGMIAHSDRVSNPGWESFVVSYH